jgi:hypothetical protein
MRYAETTNVIPFPAHDEASARLRFEHIRRHVQMLDRELQRLASGRFHGSGEWHRHTAAPLVRIQGLDGYLGSFIPGRPTMTAQERRRWHRIEAARDDLRSALMAAAASLVRLSDPAAKAAERQEVLAELPLHRARQECILTAFDELLLDEPLEPAR